MEKKFDQDKWRISNRQDFWGEIAPCDHVLQIYENDRVFIDLLEGFVVEGFNAGESVIIIATSEHLEMLNTRLRNQGYDLFSLSLSDQYIPLVSRDTLNQFMINDWPDEILFNHLVKNLLSRGRKGNRQVRAFGEMVAELWAEGLSGATVHLEHLWNKLCKEDPFSLFCAYPKSGFTHDANTSIRHICASHSKMIAASGNSKTELMYRELEKIAV
jgi:hypothetical protein